MPVPDEALEHKRTLLRDRAYIAVRDAIVSGALTPGETLRDVELEKWLGVSRTPIREAIARLELAGLVRTEPGRRTIVSTIDRKAILDAQSVAAAMHALAVRTAVPMMGTAEFEAMEQANDRFARALAENNPDLAMRSDDEFHDVAVRACQNQAVAAILDQFTPILRRLERLRFSSLAGRESIAQHRRIIALCRDGDAPGAAAAAEQNWQTLSHLAFDE